MSRWKLYLHFTVDRLKQGIIIGNKKWCRCQSRIIVSLFFQLVTTFSAYSRHLLLLALLKPYRTFKTENWRVEKGNKNFGSCIDAGFFVLLWNNCRIKTTVIKVCLDVQRQKTRRRCRISSQVNILSMYLKYVPPNILSWIRKCNCKIQHRYCKN